MYTKEQAKERYCTLLNNSTFSKRTVKTYCRFVEAFLAQCPVETAEELTIDMAADYLLKLINQGKSSSTVAAANSALRRFYEVVLGIMISKYQLPKQRIKRKPTPFLTPEQVLIMIRSCTDLRLKSAIILGFECGLRISEVVKLKRSDINPREHMIDIWESKLNKSRTVPYSPAAREILNAYYSSCYRPKGDSPDYIFPGRSPDKHLTSTTITQSFVRYGQKFNFFPEGCRFHSLWHSFASAHCRLGTDIYKITLLLGHSSIQTTLSYIHMDPTAVKDCPFPSSLWKK